MGTIIGLRQVAWRIRKISWFGKHFNKRLLCKIISTWDWRKKGHFTQAIGRSKGGLTTKIHAVVDAIGNPIRIKLTAGNVHDINPANAWLQGISLTIFFQIGHDADRLIHLAESQGSKIVIPPESNRIDQREYDRHIYKERHLVECFFAKLKVFHQVSTRYEKLAKIYRATVLIALCMVWLH
jgi:transposase